MNQDLIVYVIIASTIGYIIFSFLRGIRVEKKQSACGGCTGCELSKNK